MKDLHPHELVNYSGFGTLMLWLFSMLHIWMYYINIWIKLIIGFIVTIVFVFTVWFIMDLEEKFYSEL